ncbi:Alanine--glyoxylate aminotransferase 2-like protein 1, mitochondrial [Dichanthelium oligosanthes]|uniref:alanine--glyoxylate transaminase n=1 Tax=Dichanthelium oligosanthes TaxID=888268 RepID=A0A1E5VT15_9POAL|nr:Alanine--glyoxylate aminotransferase 2-like protein 1, mitochondrial [Dichanthelium oligosanthes]
MAASLLRRGASRRRCPSEVLRRLVSSEAAPQRAPSRTPPEMPPFDHQPRPYAGMGAAEVFEKRKALLGPSLFHYYQKPLNIVEGKMQYLYDEHGKRYLDCFGGIVTVSCGHCHPDIVNAVVEQTKLLQHTTTIYLHHAIVEFAEALTSKMPGNLKVVYFVNSGTEANELAMLMARLYSGNLSMVALRNAYHGGSAGTIGLTGLQTWKYPIPQGEIHHVMNPDPYRGTFGSDAAAYAKEVEEHITYGSSGRVAGFIAETFQGVGGAVELASGYLKLAYDIVRKAGGVCIADEVQSGFGRTGSHYWGFQTQGVIPDIVTMAKGIGNGLPLGAVVTTPEIASVLSQKIQFNTFGGNPVCSAGGLAVLKVLDKEKRQAHCTDVGAHLVGRLKSLQEKHESKLVLVFLVSVIGDVRGRGLMLGVELITDRKEKTPAKAETTELFEKLKDLGILVGKGGLHVTALRVQTMELTKTFFITDFLVDAMDYAMSGL